MLFVGERIYLRQLELSDAIREGVLRESLSYKGKFLYEVIMSLLKKNILH